MANSSSWERTISPAPVPIQRHAHPSQGGGNIGRGGAPGQKPSRPQLKMYTSKIGLTVEAFLAGLVCPQPLP
jgi:glutathione synthase/RimK-type ligase-like ATP-grasp enzyme